MNSTEIFEYIFDTFDRIGEEYVILHSYQKLPIQFDSDIDLAIKHKSIMESVRLLDRILVGTDWKLIQYWRHENYAADCVISNGEEFLQVDFCIHYERNGRVLMNVDELLSNRILYKDFYVPCSQTEFIYILLKKLLKRKFTEGSKSQLTELWCKMTSKERNSTVVSLERFLDEETIKEITAKIYRSEYDQINIHAVWNEIIKKTSDPLANINYKFFDIKRKISRMMHPTGLFVVLIGVDGSGKTTICNRMEERYVTSFRKIEHYHSRVRVLKDLSQVSGKGEVTDTSNPHGKKKKVGVLISLCKFGYYFCDFLIGNIRITKAKIKSTLVVVERYYYDYTIDKVRYNLNLSNQFLHFFGHMVKKPDIIIVLTGETQALLDRKHEISFEEIEDQKKKLSRVFHNNPEALFVDTTTNTVEQCVNTILVACNEVLRTHMLETLGD